MRRKGAAKTAPNFEKIRLGKLVKYIGRVDMLKAVGGERCAEKPHSEYTTARSDCAVSIISCYRNYPGFLLMPSS